jgi:4-amino-4-deoxy-L-arabinose transferase and related glycosyltransferases of PMT family
MNKESSVSFYDYSFGLIVSIIVPAVIYTTFAQAYYSSLSFDGAMNMQVACNILDSVGFATKYSHIVYFDHKIQTGAPLLLLDCLAFKMFGISSFTAQLPNVLYFLGCAGLIYFLLRKLTNRWLGLLGVVAFAATPNVFKFGLKGYGEIVALFFMLAALVLYTQLEKNPVRPILLSLGIGLMLGLAFLTKTVALIIAPALTVATFLDLLFFKRIRLKYHLIVLLATTLPLLSFELYKLAAMGSTDYRLWWIHEFSNITAQAGITHRFSDTNSFYAKTIKHFEILSHEFTTNLYALGIFLFLPYLLPLYRIKRYLSASFTIPVIYFTSATYFVWWLCITPTSKAWSRRIINGYIIHEILIIITLYISTTIIKEVLSEKTHLPLTISHSLLAYTLTLVFSLVASNNLSNFKIVHSFEEKKTDADVVAAKIKSLPLSARICGTGWWQASVLSFLSNRMFSDISDIPPSDKMDNLYFATDPEAWLAAKEELHEVLDKTANEVVVNRDGYALYKIKCLYPFAPFTEEEKHGHLLQIADFSKSDYQYVRGLYQLEGDLRWSRQKSAVLLQNSGQKNLVLRIQIPDMTGYHTNVVHLEVAVDGVRCRNITIDRSGEFTASLPLEHGIKATGPTTVYLALDRKWDPHSAADTRQLSFILKSVGFTS